MGSKKQSLDKLEELFISNSKESSGAMFYRNVFASACYFARIGNLQASQKLLITLFDHLGWESRKTYFRDLLGSIEEFAFEYSSEICANSEINKLFLATDKTL